MTTQLHSSNGSFELVLSAVLLGLIGFWVDSRIGTTPIFLLVFTLLGFCGAGVSVYYRYRADIARLEAERDAVLAETARIETTPIETMPIESAPIESPGLGTYARGEQS